MTVATDNLVAVELVACQSTKTSEPENPVIVVIKLRDYGCVEGMTTPKSGECTYHDDSPGVRHTLQPATWAYS